MIETKKKLFCAILNQPDKVKFREALYSYHIAQERIIVEADLNYFENSSQYERKLMNEINNENYDIEKKVRILSSGTIYLNKPNIWYLWCHYSLEDERKHDKKFLLYLFEVLK